MWLTCTSDTHPLCALDAQTHLHVDMCPNITAVTNSSLSPSNSGYVLKAAKDSVNGMLSFVGALLVGSVADKVSNCCVPTP